MAAIEFLSRGGLSIPNPPAFLLMVVVSAAFLGGLRSGLVTACIAWGYFAYFFSLPGRPFHYADADLRRVVVWAFTTPAMAIMVGVLEQRARRAFAMARERAALAEQLAAREHAQEALEQLAAIIESSDDAVFSTALDGTILNWNRGAERIYGYPAEEAVGRPVSFLSPPERADEAADIMARILRGERLRHYETVRVRKDGRRIDVSLAVSPIKDAMGRVVGISAIARDITERKQAEAEIRALNARLEQRVLEQTAELRDAKAFLETLVTLSPSIIFKVDVRDTRERAMSYVSPNIERILGYRPGEVLGVPGFWEAHVHPEDREAFRAATATALREHRTQFEQEVRTQHKDGSYRWMHSVFCVEYDQSGAPASILGYDQDVTARRTAEAAVTQSRVEAERANRAKSEFLSRMSHELRTPLNAILGFAQLLEMDSLGPQQRESVEHILKGGRHLLRLINEVLDIARIEAGRLTISPEPVRLRDVVQETLDLMRPLAAEMSVQLADDAAGARALHVLADSQRLKQVLLNLVSNAIKYGGRGGTVTLSCEDVPGRRVRIKVNDTGPGIPPDKMARLFIPFERLGGGQTGVEGTGLGLALSKGLVEAMGGTVGVDSAVGRGSTFWVEFAATESPLERLEPHGQEEPSPALPVAAARIGTVLHIEDNLSNFELVRHLLTQSPQVKLLAAMQGRLGLEMARQHRPDLILLDLHLPDISGEEMLRQLQEAPETRDIPVVVISADATVGRAGRLVEAGAHSYLTKPLDVKKFLALLDEILERSEAGHARGQQH